MKRVDLLIHSAAQLVTCASPGGARRGPQMRELGIVPDGALAIADGTIVAAGATEALLAAYEAEEELDAHGRVVCPGFVDPHTHAVYAGDRVDEFEKRLGGASYQDIAAAGGGILSTVRATRSATVPTLVQQAQFRLGSMFRLGTTTVEVKTGYGLDATTEMKLLRAIDRLDKQGPAELVPTFMAAHAVPPEFAGKADEYVSLVIEELLPAAAQWHRASHFATAGRPLFVDVFCEKNAFDLAQSRRVLEAGREQALPLKAHVDEFSELGGLAMALELGAVSVDHLDVTGAAGIAALAASRTVGVVIPTVPFNLGATAFANARAMIDAGAAIALTTDINPGSSPCYSMPLAMAIACRYQRLTPAEALAAATINAAHAIGMGERIGSLEAGKQADVLVCDIPDFRYLAYEFGANPVIEIVKQGKIAA